MVDFDKLKQGHNNLMLGWHENFRQKDWYSIKSDEEILATFDKLANCLVKLYKIYAINREEFLQIITNDLYDLYESLKRDIKNNLLPEKIDIFKQIVEKRENMEWEVYKIRQKYGMITE